MLGMVTYREHCRKSGEVHAVPKTELNCADRGLTLQPILPRSLVYGQITDARRSGRYVHELKHRVAGSGYPGHAGLELIIGATPVPSRILERQA